MTAPRMDLAKLAEMAAALRGNPDPELVVLAARRKPARVATQAGVKKYGQPIGTVITPAMAAAAKNNAALASLRARLLGPNAASSTPAPSAAAATPSAGGRRAATDADLKLGAKLHIGSGSTLYRVVHYDAAKNLAIVARDSTPGTPPVSKGTWYPASKFQVPAGSGSSAPSAAPSAPATPSPSPSAPSAPAAPALPSWYTASIKGNGPKSSTWSDSYKREFPTQASFLGWTLPAGLTWDQIAEDAPGGMSTYSQRAYLRKLMAAEVKTVGTPAAPAPSTPASVPGPASAPAWYVSSGVARPPGMNTAQLASWNALVNDPSPAYLPAVQRLAVVAAVTPGLSGTQKIAFYKMLEARNNHVGIPTMRTATPAAPAAPTPTAPANPAVAVPGWASGVLRPAGLQKSASDLWDEILQRDVSHRGTKFTDAEIAKQVPATTPIEMAAFKLLKRYHNDAIDQNTTAHQNLNSATGIGVINALNNAVAVGQATQAPVPPAATPAAPPTVPVPKRKPGTAYGGGATARAKAAGPLPKSPLANDPAYKAALATRTAALPFDLKTAPRPTKVAWAKAEGANWTHSTPKGDLDAWITAHLMRDIDPSGSQIIKDEVESRAERSWNTSQALKAASRGVQAFAQANANVAPTAAAQPSASPTPPLLSPATPVIHARSSALTFTKSAKQAKLAGWAEKYQVDDQFGNVWIFKPEVSVRGGVSGAYRSDMENAAHVIGQHLGFDSAESRMTKIDGKRGHVQRMFSGVVGDLTAVDVTTLTSRERQDIADEHLLDWVLANHDGHYENLLRLANGTIVGIDKGQAFKYFGKDKLEVGYRPGPMQTKSNPVDDLYNAIISGRLSQGSADELVKSALERAARIQDADDQVITDALMEAQKKRPNETFRDGRPNNATELAEQVVQRKNRLVKDFERFYADIYAKAGLKFDRDKLLPPSVLQAQQSTAAAASSKPGTGDKGKVEGAFSGVSDNLLAAAKRSQINGVASMFAGTDIEDGNILFWHEEWAGDDVLRAQFTTREEADKRVMAWLNQNAGHLVSARPGARSGPATKPEDLVQESDWWTQINDIAKNYAAHAGSNPATYSDRRIQQSADLQRRIAQMVTQVAAGRNAGYGIADEDVPNWLGMAGAYSQILVDLEVHRTNGTKPSRAQRYVMIPPPAGAQAPAASAPTMKIEVSKVTNSRQQGVLDTIKGILRVKDPKQLDLQTGEMYTIKVDDDVEIEYRPWSSGYSYSGVPLSQQGVLRVVKKNPTGKAVDFDKATKVLEEMGIDLKPAEADDLELLYWRTQAGVLKTRAEGSGGGYGSRSIAYTDTMDHLRRHVTQGQSAREEIDAIKAAFKLIPGADTKAVDDAEWRPQFSHTRSQDVDLETGRPYFLRPDMAAKDMRKITKGHFPTHAITGGSLLDIARSGQLVSAEERIRLLGRFTNGSHAQSDQQTGGANWLFGNFGIDSSKVTFGSWSRWSQTSKPMILMNPDVLRRTSTWHYSQMQSGSLANRTSSNWDPKKWTASSSNAIHVKNAISFLDDIEVVGMDNQADADEYIKFLEDHGITEIRGVAVTDRVVDRNNAVAWKAAQDKAWFAYEQRAGKKVKATASGGIAATGAGSHPALVTNNDATSYIAGLAGQGQVKGLMSALRKATTSMGAVMGVKKKRIEEATAEYDANFPGGAPVRYGRALSPRAKVFPLVDKDSMDVDLLNKYINDPTSITEVPQIDVINGRYYLVSGVEAYYALRLQGGSTGRNGYNWIDVEQRALRFDYTLSQKAGIP